MKVIINACYGGFGFSTEAVKRAIELGSAAVHVHSETEFGGGPKCFATDKPKDAGDGYTVGWIKDILFKDGKVYTIRDEDNFRSDPILIQIVEEMGDLANGTHAELKIVEIPDDVAWGISEYDGFEHVAELHRVWS